MKPLISTLAQAPAERPHQPWQKPVRIRESSRLKQINPRRRCSWRRLRAQPQMRENALNHHRFFDPCPEYFDKLRIGSVEGTAMIFNFPPHTWQCSISMSYTRLSKRAQLIRTGALWACACVQSPSPTVVLCTGASSSGCMANRLRSGIGNDSTHSLAGTSGMTHATRYAAVSAMRRLPHEGPQFTNSRAACS